MCLRDRIVLRAASTVVRAACEPLAVVRSIEETPAPAVATAAVTLAAIPTIAAVACVPPSVMPADELDDKEIAPAVVAVAAPDEPAVVAVMSILRPSAAVSV